MGSLAKGLAVIETFSAARPRQSISEVAAISGLDRATARRCLLTLAHLGYADYNGKHFTLRPRVLRLGTACLATMSLPHLVQPWLDSLSKELDDSTSVLILDEDESQLEVDAPVARLVGIGQRRASDCPNAHVVKLAGLSRQTHFDIAQAFAVGQLRKGHDAKLLGATEAARHIDRRCDGRSSTAGSP